MTGKFADSEYQSKIAAESKKWGEHLKVEASGEWNAWLDHPLIAEHYRERGLIDGLPWEQWVSRELAGPAERSLDLGCGAGSRSIVVYEKGASGYIEGLDVSEDRIAEGERIRRELGIPGRFQVTDTNRVKLPAETYDLIFSCHSFHHFFELEHIMEQVHQSLTRRGLFILEEFVGPTQFQWTDQQIEIVRWLMSLVPEELRRFRWGAIKNLEGRPTPAEVVAVSPFESIRSAEILPLFQHFFRVVVIKRLAGTIQHLLYNGIAHNFHPGDPVARGSVQAVWEVEDALIDSGLLPSDFMLLIGQRRD
jgi:SAM-dependent methyltransferase